MSRQPRARPQAIEFTAKFDPSLVGAALARLWEFDGSHLVKVLDTHGMSAACPITCEPFVCPVMLCDGQIYEETSISSWLQTSETSPSTNLPVRHESHPA